MIGSVVSISVIVIMILYMLAIMPRVYQRPNYSPLFGTYYAHRGLHDEGEKVPENSQKAFLKAVEAGYGIELDVQLTKDNRVVVFHDEELKRVCGVEGKISEYTYAELKQFCLAQSNETIPTFAEVLALVQGKVPLIVEIKMHSMSTKVCECTDALLKSYKGIYCIESFHPLAVMWYRNHRKEIIRGQLSSDFRKELGKETVAHFVVHHLLTNFMAKPDFIAYSHIYQKSLSRTICHKFYKGLSIAWTIRSQKELDHARNGFDLFIFECFTPLESESR